MPKTPERCGMYLDAPTEPRCPEPAIADIEWHPSLKGSLIPVCIGHLEKARLINVWRVTFYQQGRPRRA